jgi:hypothetical protein
MLILFKLYVFSSLMSMLQAHIMRIPVFSSLKSMLQAHIMRIPQATMKFIYFHTLLLKANSHTRMTELIPSLPYVIQFHHCFLTSFFKYASNS